jgi:hypothetical protein
MEEKISTFLTIENYIDMEELVGMSNQVTLVLGT